MASQTTGSGVSQSSYLRNAYAGGLLPNECEPRERELAEKPPSVVDW